MQDIRTAVIVDVDGTLCDVTTALHHLTGPHRDFEAFHQATALCPPTPRVVEWCRQQHAAGHAVIVVTARKYQHEALTTAWLDEHLPVPVCEQVIAGQRHDLHRMERKWVVLEMDRRGRNPAEIAEAVGITAHAVRKILRTLVPAEVDQATDAGVMAEEERVAQWDAVAWDVVDLAHDVRDIDPRIVMTRLSACPPERLRALLFAALAMVPDQRETRPDQMLAWCTAIADYDQPETKLVAPQPDNIETQRGKKTDDDERRRQAAGLRGRPDAALEGTRTHRGVTSAA